MKKPARPVLDYYSLKRQEAMICSDSKSRISA
jgi:hypothetical protein